MTLTAVKKGLGLNPGEGMDVCKCIVPLRHGSTLNSCRVASPLLWLVEGKGELASPDDPQSALPQNWGVTEPPVTFVVLKATVTTCVHPSPMPQ
ncbi:uncharacterized protein TNCV_2708091 [Trichonephila clavipes]|nr:uncharacterized protein TNCV_2708091 [Trichonephila clavipes]